MLHRPLAIILLIILSVNASTLSYNIYYDIRGAHGQNDSAVDCVNKAIDAIQKKTCLKFIKNSSPPGYPYAVHFVIDSNICGYQQANETVHLSTKCVNEERCIQLIHRAVYGERGSVSTIFTTLNQKFNCTDLCSKKCENGAKVSSDYADCQCICARGYEGEHCTDIKNDRLYSDASCGFINVSHSHNSSGYLRLNDSVKTHGHCIWALKSEDAWDTFELQFIDLDLSDEHPFEGHTCGDHLQVFGVKGLEKPIPCINGNETAYIGKKYYSDGNLVFIEFRGNSMDDKYRKGPVIKYVIRTTPLKDDVEMYKALHRVGENGNGSANGAFSSVTSGHGVLLFVFMVAFCSSAVQRFF